MDAADWTHKTLLFMGKPGSGKGTQAKLLAERTGFSIFSTGKRIRQLASEERSPLGRRLKEGMESGYLVPYWLASYLFEEALFSLEADEGIIFEGAARKEPEARLFHEIAEWLGRPYLAINLDIADATVEGRIASRREQLHRADDDPEDLAVRFEEYREHTKPAIDYFRSVGTLIDVDGEPAPEEVHRLVIEAIERANK